MDLRRVCAVLAALQLALGFTLEVIENGKFRYVFFQFLFDNATNLHNQLIFLLF